MAQCINAILSWNRRLKCKQIIGSNSPKHMLQENIRKRRHLPHGPILGEGVVDPAREGRSLAGQTTKQLITGCEDFWCKRVCNMINMLYCKRRSMTTAPYIPNVAKTYQIEQYEMYPSRTLTWLCKSWLPFAATSIVTPSSALWHLSACQPFWSQHCSLKFHPLWGPVPRPFPSALPHLGSEIGPCLPEDHQSTFRNLFISEELGLYVHPSKRKYNPRGVDNK